MGTIGATLTHGLTTAENKGGWLIAEPLHNFTSSMGHAFFIAIVAWSTCFVVTVVVSLFTKPRAESELKGLVYSLTDRPSLENVKWHQRPGYLAIIVLSATAFLNYLFW
jgi:SSS family solute:Na+ symporter